MTSSRETALLAHFLPPPEFGMEAVCLLRSERGENEWISPRALGEHGVAIVTYRREAIHDVATRYEGRSPECISIEMALRLVAGHPASFYGTDSTPWDFPAGAARALSAEFDVHQVLALLHGLPMSMGVDVQSPLIGALNHLAQLWEWTQREMKRRGEWERFWSVEVPCDRVLQKSEKVGMLIDGQAVERHLQELDGIYFKLHRGLGVERGIDVSRALTDAAYLRAVVEPGVELDVWDVATPALQLVDYLRASSAVCGELHRLYKVRQSRKILDRMGILVDARCRPSFECIGTVTARATMKAPSLQNLGRRYRDIVVAREGYRLLYVDYEAFEPHILASLSGDTALLDACSFGDLYENLAISLGLRGRRAEVKSMFLAYSYGMEEGRMASWATGMLGCSREEGGRVARVLYTAHPQVESWKRRLCTTLSSEGRVGTLLGNYRYRTSDGGELQERERRWAVSQMVQGTGSLILKRALIELLDSEPAGVNLLLPMHDAALFEVEKDIFDDVARTVRRAFRKAAAETLMGLEIPAVVGSFSLGAT